jgi:hypothetical protein
MVTLQNSIFPSSSVHTAAATDPGLKIRDRRWRYHVSGKWETALEQQRWTTKHNVHIYIHSSLVLHKIARAAAEAVAVFVKEATVRRRRFPGIGSLWPWRLFLRIQGWVVCQGILGWIVSMHALHFWPLSTSTNKQNAQKAKIASLSWQPCFFLPLGGIYIFRCHQIARLRKASTKSISSSEPLHGPIARCPL